jgi:adenylyltransferase/sulfurtransferase
MASDNFATRYLVSDACYFAKKPLVTAAVGTFDGSLTSIRAHEKSATGTPNPTYRCLFPRASAARHRASLRRGWDPRGAAGRTRLADGAGDNPEIVGFGEGLVGRLLMVDARFDAFRNVELRMGSNNPLNGSKPTIKDLSQHRG